VRSRWSSGRVDRAGHRPAGQHRQAPPGRRPAPSQPRRRRRGPGRRRFQASTATVEVSSPASLHPLVETATRLGEITGVIPAAGAHQPGLPDHDPGRGPGRHRRAARGVRHRDRRWRGRGRDRFSVRAPPRPLPAAQTAALATTPPRSCRPADAGPEQVTDSLHADQPAKRANALGVLAEAVRWGRHRARVNPISRAASSPRWPPTSLAALAVPATGGCWSCPGGPGRPPDEVATLAALLLAPTVGSSPAATSSSTAASPPPTSTATSPHNDRTRQSSPPPSLRRISVARSQTPGQAAGGGRKRHARRGVAGRRPGPAPGS
jgi:hypothetical protein